MYDIEAERAYPTPLANSTLLPLLLLSLASQKHSPCTKKVFRKEYDYVVVGAGSAGSVVASRLSEMPCVSVLLLEAGKAPPLLTEVPAFATDFVNTDVDWRYHTVPQKNSRVYPGRKIPCPRGKALGGSSSINGNQYVRGNHKDFDDWAAGGADGWSFNDVLPYFKKMEDNKNPEYVENGYHGVDGEVTVSLPCYQSEMKTQAFEALKKIGYSEVDSNGPTQTGIYKAQLTERDGQRCGTAKAYLVPKENSANLDIVTNAFVTKVDIEDLRATGVRFEIKGRKYHVKARKEVILSAGAYNTPQLLMLSGVGPAEHLNELGIPVVSDLPVGHNFQDHSIIYLPYELGSNVKSFDEKITEENTLREYIDHRSGLMTVCYRGIIHCFVNNAFSDPAEDFPPIQLMFFEASNKALKKEYVPQVYNRVFAPYENKTIGQCGAILQRPETRGFIKLKSKNPYDPPIIDFQHLDHPSDFEHMIEGLKICQRIMTSNSMQKIGSKPLSTVFPGCEDSYHNEDLYIRCVARIITTTAHHPVGSTKMGQTSDIETVVDSQLRVKTIEGLRVVDASVMPKVTSGNTNAPTIMIGEKASDMIKETISCPQQCT